MADSSKRNISLPVYRTAHLVPKSFNADELTVNLVAATEKEITQRDDDGKLYKEVLRMDRASNVRLDRFNYGANVLDNHRSSGSVRQDVVGVVVKAWIENRELNVVIKFSKRSDVQPLVQDVQDGIITNVSILYRVYRYEVLESGDELPLLKAIDWEPLEVSFVAIPADFNAGSRNEKLSNKNIISVKTNSSESNKSGDNHELELNQHSESASPNSRSQDKEIITATKAERKRSEEIISACRTANLSIEFAEKLISDEHVDINKARELILTELASGMSKANTRNTSMAVVTDDEQVRERSALEVALLNRADPQHFDINGKTDVASVVAAQKFRNISLLGTIHKLLEQRGTSVSPFDKQELFKRSMSTGDFPNLFSSVANKFLRHEYDAAPKTFSYLSVNQNLPDFKSVSGIQFGGDIKFEEIKEGSEFKQGALVESADQWRLSTYGKILKLSRQMIINDDLNAFIRLGKIIALGASNNESNIFWSLITSNVKMGDNQVLFHSTHGNLASPGAALTSDSMSLARTALRRQKGLTNTELIVVAPKFIVVAPEQEMAADQLLTNITPAESGKVNPFPAAGLVKIVEPRLSAGPWYVFADQKNIQSFTYGYLEGNEGLFTESEYGFEVDGIRIKARTDFAAKAWDWRGVYKNPGA